MVQYSIHHYFRNFYCIAAKRQAVIFLWKRVTAFISEQKGKINLSRHFNMNFSFWLLHETILYLLVYLWTKPSNSVNEQNVLLYLLEGYLQNCIRQVPNSINVWRIITIYAPMIYTAPCVMLGPVNRIETIDECHLGPKNSRYPGPNPLPTCPSNGCCTHQNHYARGRINYRCMVVLCTRAHPGKAYVCTVHTSIICVHTCINTCAYMCRWFRFAQLAKGKKFRP